MTAPPTNNTLSNVIIIRTILIILLVFYHAFAIYSGSWKPLDGIEYVPVYCWLDKLSYAFMLELFVFISGYVFGYQVSIKGVSKLQAKSLFMGKFKRLMIPCIVFSFFYIILLGNIKYPIYKNVYDLLNGVGHMWFLPMLFWCFVGVWGIEKILLKPTWTIIILTFAAICSFLPLPLMMGSTMYYLLFFYVGYIIRKKNYSPDWFHTKKCMCISTVLFIVLFPLLTLLKEYIDASYVDIDCKLETKIVIFSFLRTLRLIYASIGIIMILSWVDCYQKKHMTTFLWMEQIASLSFGVYLFQQFILKGLYDHTSLPSLLGCYWLPWVGFMIALFGSLLMTYLFRKTKIGRAIIG